VSQAIFRGGSISLATELAALHAEMRACRRCAAAGFPIEPAAVFSGPATARVMIVGQAPGRVELGGEGIPFGRRRSGQRSTLWLWLEEAGFVEEDFRVHHYLTAITKCYPGRSAGGKGDRVPTARERALCASFLVRELALICPVVIIPIGTVAIRRFLGQRTSLDEAVGNIFHREDAWVVPLPHPSGVNRWLNDPANRQRLKQALAHLRQLKEDLTL
jgi:uracil-DNA glycosylase family 4